VCFRNPNADGTARQPHMLQVPEVPLPWLQNNQNLVAMRTAAWLDPDAIITGANNRQRQQPPGSGAVSPMFLTGNSSSPILYANERAQVVNWTDTFRNNSNDGAANATSRKRRADDDAVVDPANDGDVRPVSVKDIVGAIAAVLEKLDGCPNEVLDSDDRGSAFVRTLSKKCSNAPDGVQHRNNHVLYIVEIGLPAPRVVVHCQDPVCVAHYKKDPSKRETITIPDHMLGAIRKMTARNMRRQPVLAAMLDLG
jgi:hypothetical protein